MTSHAALALPQMKKMLENLEKCLDKAEIYAAERKFTVDDLLVARLAPDQFPLVRQIQSACDTAKLAAARLSASEAPRHPDVEKTFPEIRARLRATLDFLSGIDAKRLEEADERLVTMAWLEGKTMLGIDYLHQFALPNLYFHVTTAYAILRHNGVPVGKWDFLGALPLRPPV